MNDAGREWLIDRFREQAKESGVFVTAKRWRKQGMPIEVALAVCGNALRDHSMRSFWNHEGIFFRPVTSEEARTLDGLRSALRRLA